MAGRTQVVDEAQRRAYLASQPALRRRSPEELLAIMERTRRVPPIDVEVEIHRARDEPGA